MYQNVNRSKNNVGGNIDENKRKHDKILEISHTTGGLNFSIAGRKRICDKQKHGELK